MLRGLGATLYVGAVCYGEWGKQLAGFGQGLGTGGHLVRGCCVLWGVGEAALVQWTDTADRHGCCTFKHLFTASLRLGFRRLEFRVHCELT